VTLLLLNHRNIAPSAICSCCGIEDETLFHCVRDCKFSRIIWHHVGFHDVNFFAIMDVSDWLKVNFMCSYSFLFANTVWWAWCHYDHTCLSNENWILSRLSNNIHIMVDSFKYWFAPNFNVGLDDILIKWNKDNHFCAIFNVKGGCLGTPVRADFGGVICNNACFYLSGFLSYIYNSFDIVYIKLYAIYQGLLLEKVLDITKLICNSNSMQCINLLKGPPMKFHVYAVLSQDVNDLIQHSNITVCHTPIERVIIVRIVW